MNVKGFDLDKIKSPGDIMAVYKGIGIQATNLSKAYDILKEIVENNYHFTLSFTSTVGSSGLREIMAQFIRDTKPNVIITTAGAIEEDFMKTFIDFKIGDFNLDDGLLNKEGYNRIGNILVPNDAYVRLEESLKPILNEMSGSITPNYFITKLAEKISDKYSFLKAARDVGAKIFCPAITDGALGIQFFMHKQKNPNFKLDVTGDMYLLSESIMSAEKTGAFILGGGIIKHHTIGAHLLRGGLDRAVYISTSFEQDASLSGAQTKEAVSWGKLKENATSVNVWAEYSMTFPLIALAIHNHFK